MFSKRLSWDDAPNRLSQLLSAKRRAGTVLDLTESNPTRAGFAYSQDQFLDARAAYDPAPRGIARARDAVAEYYARRGVQVPASSLLLTASTSEAYAYLFKLLADPGDQILAPRPSYPLFEFLAALESVEVRQYPLRYDGSWHVDFDALVAQITPRTRAVVVVNPNNPTGSSLKRGELAKLDALASERNLAILSDEVFADYGFAEDAGRVATLIGDRQALTFSMSGLSKIAGLPQMKLGWICANGPHADEALDRLELIADTYLSVSTPVQEGLAAILAGADAVQRQIRERTARNLAHLRQTMLDSSAEVLRVEGGWYAVLQVPRTRTEEEWCMALLEERDVLVQPGFFFDFETEAYLVLSLLTPADVFAEGIHRLRAFL